MTSSRPDPLWGLMGCLFRSHPWHGVSIGDKAPDLVTAYIEVVPTDTVKYELDKTAGLLKIDRPQSFSSLCPTLYGLIPQTLCGEHVAALSAQRTGLSGLVGDGDPLDICVLTEKAISHGDILLQAIPIGGFRMLDGNEADDKIIAALERDAAYGHWRDLTQCPPVLVDRRQHYFLTYKKAPGMENNPCRITHRYGRQEAHDVIQSSHRDYAQQFGALEDLLTSALRDQG